MSDERNEIERRIMYWIGREKMKNLSKLLSHSFERMEKENLKLVPDKYTYSERVDDHLQAGDTVVLNLEEN